MPLRRTLLTALLALAGLCCGQAQAQIRISQTAGFTGAAASGVNEATAGAERYLTAVNSKGGIAGQKLELVSLNDKFDRQLAVENAKLLIGQRVIALFLSRGTPHSLGLMPLLAKSRITLVAPSSGAMALHAPVNPWVFNVRATYQREAERAIKPRVQTGAQRIAIVQVADSFGEDAVLGALRGFGSRQKPVVYDKCVHSQPDFAAAVPRILAANAQAVLVIGTGTDATDAMKALRAAGSRAQLLTLSNNASAGFVESLGKVGRSVIVSQVLPSERSLATPMVKEAQDLARAVGSAGPEITPTRLEGFAGAKGLVEGLRRAAAKDELTRTGLQQALDGITGFDLGGLALSDSSTDHSGLNYADLSIVGVDGRFRR
jgi:branched-chain amino acid transport system substrate-binding protein